MTTIYISDSGDDKNEMVRPFGRLIYSLERRRH